MEYVGEYGCTSKESMTYQVVNSGNISSDNGNIISGIDYVDRNIICGNIDGRDYVDGNIIRGNISSDNGNIMGLDNVDGNISS
ncbi:hypothetical protein NAPIS_ORF02081 [Vairimorpha apis BRL 01]|nr:hypothetical protein NAPIS_ORF02081 [Vairimorpha apis BRL 01]